MSYKSRKYGKAREEIIIAINIVIKQYLNFGFKKIKGMNKTDYRNTSIFHLSPVVNDDLDDCSSIHQWPF